MCFTQLMLRAWRNSFISYGMWSMRGRLYVFTVYVSSSVKWRLSELDTLSANEGAPFSGSSTKKTKHIFENLNKITMIEPKRKAEEQALVHVKRPRNELVPASMGGSIVSAGPPRTSNLLAPIMLLTGHGAEIFSAKFHPDGNTLASGSFDRNIFLWSVYGECDNYAVLRGHQGAIMELQYTTDGQLVSCSTDKLVCLWDTETGARIKKMRGHTAFVNSVFPARRGPSLIVSGGDDGTIKLWDSRKRGVVQTFQNTYQVLAVSFNDTSDQIVSAGIDNDIKVWDLRKNGLLYKMPGHTDSVTGLSLSGDGSYLLSNSMDNTLRIWDIRPFAPQERCVKLFQGAQHNFEQNLLRCAWSPDGSKIAAGSADRFVYVWDTTSRRILYKLPGHAGSVNDVAFHPREPIVLSCSSDKQIYLGEIM